MNKFTDVIPDLDDRDRSNEPDYYPEGYRTEDDSDVPFEYRANCQINDTCDACNASQHNECEGVFVRYGSQMVCHCCNCTCGTEAA